MSGPVDVLAVFARVATHYKHCAPKSEPRIAEAMEVAKEFRDAAVEFYAGLQAMALCQQQDAPADITAAINKRTARACERFDAALLRFDGGSA